MRQAPRIPPVCHAGGPNGKPVEIAVVSYHVASNRRQALSDIRQNAARNRFELDMDGGLAIAVYRLGGGVMTFTHTEVPSDLRGRGVGSGFMRAVLENVRAQGLQVVAACPFVADYIDRHPEFADLLA
jgi:predicted GNAT family acetyltransferase